MPRNHSVDKHHLTGRLKCSEVSREKLGHILEYIFVYARIGKSNGPSERKGALKNIAPFFVEIVGRLTSFEVTNAQSS